MRPPQSGFVHVGISVRIVLLALIPEELRSGARYESGSSD